MQPQARLFQKRERYRIALGSSPCLAIVTQPSGIRASHRADGRHTPLAAIAAGTACSPSAKTSEEPGVFGLDEITANDRGLPSWMNHEPKARYVRIAFNIEPLHPDLVLLQEVWTKSAAAVPPTNIGWLIARAPSANFFRRNGLMILSRMPISGGGVPSVQQGGIPRLVSPQRRFESDRACTRRAAFECLERASAIGCTASPPAADPAIGCLGA